MIARWFTYAALLLAGLFLLGEATAATPTQQAHLVAGPCGGNPGPTSIESMWADASTLFVGRADGHVQAIDRSDGHTLWTWPSTFEPNAGVRSVVGDGTRIYVAISEVTNGADDPVLALDKATGQELWRRPSLRTDPLRAADPFRLALDTTDASDPYLYVGMNGGVILKLARSDGQPLTQPDGSLQRYTPPGHADSPEPNGIYALLVGNGRILAARDWGNTSAGRPVDLWNSNNTVLDLNLDLTPASGTGEFHLLGTGGTTPRTDAIFAMWQDGTGPLYLVGSEAKKTGKTSFIAEAVVHRATVGSGDMQATAAVNGTALQYYIETPAPGGGVVRNYVGAAVAVNGDADGVYVGTQTAGGDTRGYLTRLNKDLTVQSDWPARTSFEAGGVRSIVLNGGDLLVAHECSLDANRAQGALVFETGRSVAPRVVLDQPLADTLSNGRIEVVAGSIPFGASSYTARLSLGHPDAQGAYTYTPFEDLGIHLLGLTYSPTDVMAAAWHGVLLPPDTVPDGHGYRVRIDVSTPQGVTQDFSDGTFTLDRRAPDIEEILPQPGQTLTDAEPIVHVAIRDLDGTGAPGTLVDTAASTVTLNGLPLHGVVFETNGLHVQVGGADNLPLREGLNDFVATIQDRAGNVATRAWQLRLDTQVETPSFSPVSGSFVADDRPFLRAVVAEPVTLVSAEFNGTVVTDQVTSVQGPDGSTVLQFRPTAALSAAYTYNWRLVLRDAIGNQDTTPFHTTFRVDDQLPDITPIDPQPGSLTIDDRPTIRFSAGDAGSGLVSRSVTLYLDGVDRTSALKQEADRNLYVLTLLAPLRGGEHTLAATAVDVAGNVRTLEWTFHMDLDAPHLAMQVLMPNDQTALKRGDHAVVRVTTTDDSALRAVRLDARALDSARNARESMLAVPGRPGVYEANLTVQQAGTSTVTLVASAEDAAGHVGQAHTDLIVDNSPPTTVLDDLPPYVGASFQLTWRNDPKDEAVGGSGIAYYRVEQQVAGGPWTLIRPRLADTSVAIDVPDTEFRALAYRVTAVDNAGNVQVVPSNVASTQSRGDPFPTVQLPTTLAIGQPTTLAATASANLNLENGLARLQLQGADGRNYTRTLDAFGRLYSTSWNLTEVPEGDYVARFIFRDADGFEMASVGHTVHVGATALAEQSLATKAAPAAVLAPMAALGLAVAIRRRRP